MDSRRVVSLPVEDGRRRKRIYTGVAIGCNRRNLSLTFVKPSGRQQFNHGGESISRMHVI